MLFCWSLWKARPGKSKEATARRLDWQWPEGIRVIGEYWPQAAYPSLASIPKADSVVPIVASTAAGDDVFEITVFPAITAEEGMAMARQSMSK